MRNDIDEELTADQKKAQAAAAAPVTATTAASSVDATPNSNTGTDQAADKA